MKRYLIGLLIIYVCNLKETLSTDQVQQTNTVVDYDLRKLRQSGHTSKEDLAHGTRKFVYDVPTNTDLRKVFYHKTDLWTLGSDGKKLKKLEAWEKGGVLQLVHLKLAKDNAEEDLYYKKVKNEFQKFSASGDYTTQSESLKNNKDHFVDEWFAFDFRKKEEYLVFFRENLTMVDGVWKKTLTLLRGKPYAMTDGEQEVWAHNNEAVLSSLVEYDFGDDKYLLVPNFTGTEKYYVKNGSGTWAALKDKAEFATKFNEFKSKYFETELEYDLSQPPDLQKFSTQRKVYEGNVTQLTLYPVRNYYVSKVKYNGVDVWTSTKEKRASTLNLLLLGYEVKQFNLHEWANSEPHTTKYNFKYFVKDKTAFVEKKKTEYNDHKKKVESLGDKTRPFYYNDSWAQTSGRLDLSQYNKSEFEVATETDKLVVKTKLNPKSNNVFNQVGFKSTQLWPSANNQATNPVVKEVKYVSKESSLQLVYVKGTKSRGGADSAQTDELELFFKKDGEDFVPLTSQQHGQYLNLLQEQDYFVSKEYDVDVTDEELNPVFFKVVKEYFDGVEKRVVTPFNTKVTRVHSLNHDLWRQPYGYKDKFLNEYELFVLGDTMMLKLKFLTGLSTTYNWEYYEKLKNLQWTSLEANTFNTKLNALRNVSQWEALELDLSTKPLKTKFNVVVNRLNGNRTELVLTPLWQKKLVKVKLGSTDVWTSTQNKRVERVYLYLEGYHPKFLKLDVLTPQTSGTPLKSEEKFYKQTSTFATVSDFDNQLSQFKTHNNNVAFTYNENWELPPEVLDPKSYPSEFFDFAKTTETLVATLKYTPKTQAVVKKVLYDGVKVWPEGDTENTTKKLEFLEVFTKHDMVQLLHLRNVLVETPNTPEDLYFKKVKDTYQKVDQDNFNQLKTKLADAESYVDDNVKLDLTEEVSTELFAKETTVEDGLEKEVVQLLHGKLYEVKASPALWTSTDGSYVKKLEKYNLGDSQLLVLYVTKTNNSVEKLYFQKPTAPPQPAPSTTTQETQQRTETAVGDQRTPQQQGETTGVQPPQEVPPAAPVAPRPSFSAMQSSAEFFKKLNQKKASVQYTNVELNLNSYNDTSKFKVVQSQSTNYTVYKLYPLSGKRLTRLLHETVEHWTPKTDGQRLVEVWLYLHDEKVKFVKGLVWEKDHTDQSTDQVVLLQLNTSTNKYEVKDQTSFDNEFQKVLAVKPQPLPLSTGVVLPTKTRAFKKLFLGLNVDSQLFTLNNANSEGKSVRTLAPKNDVFVNLVETRGSVLWKSYQKDDLWKSATVTTKGDLGHAELTVSENSVDVNKYFKFSNDVWTKVNLEEFNKLKAATGSLEQASRAPQQGAVQQEPQRDSAQPQVTPREPQAEQSSVASVPAPPQPGHSQTTGPSVQQVSSTSTNGTQESSGPDASSNNQGSGSQVVTPPESPSNGQGGGTQVTGNQVTNNQVGQEAPRVETRGSNPEQTTLRQVGGQPQGNPGVGQTDGGHQTGHQEPVGPGNSDTSQSTTREVSDSGSSPGQGNSDRVGSGGPGGSSLGSQPSPETGPERSVTNVESRTGQGVREVGPTVSAEQESPQADVSQQQDSQVQEPNTLSTPGPVARSEVTEGRSVRGPSEERGQQEPNQLQSDTERTQGLLTQVVTQDSATILTGGSGSRPGPPENGSQREDSPGGVPADPEASSLPGGGQANQASVGHGERGSPASELPSPQVPDAVTLGQSEDSSEKSVSQGDGHVSTDGRGGQESQVPSASGVGGQSGAEGVGNTGRADSGQETDSAQNRGLETPAQDQETKLEETPETKTRSQESQDGTSGSSRVESSPQGAVSQDTLGAEQLGQQRLDTSGHRSSQESQSPGDREGAAVGKGASSPPGGDQENQGSGHQRSTLPEPDATKGPEGVTNDQSKDSSDESAPEGKAHVSNPGEESQVSSGVSEGSGTDRTEDGQSPRTGPETGVGGGDSGKGAVGGEPSSSTISVQEPGNVETRDNSSGQVSS